MCSIDDDLLLEEASYGAGGWPSVQKLTNMALIIVFGGPLSCVNGAAWGWEWVHLGVGVGYGARFGGALVLAAFFKFGYGCGVAVKLCPSARMLRAHPFRSLKKLDKYHSEHGSGI